MSIVSGITGILIPALLISVLPITQGGFITLENGYEQLQLLRLFTSPHEYMFIGIAITLFLSSLLLADFSNVLGEREAFLIYRRDARIVGPITILLAIAVVITMSNEATWIYTNLRSHTGWLVASAGFFLLSYASLFGTSKRKGWLSLPRLATIAAIIQYLLASYAYGVSHLPYLVYPNVTIESGFTHPNNFRAMFIVYIVGFAILTPGFIYFWRLFMNDTTEAKKS
nr:cytochrome d ubiquinol oxidase subunit II [Brevibacillus laterosporus]